MADPILAVMQERTSDVVLTFLSCSVRAKDRAIVDAIQRDVLEPNGFRCFTVGRNVSLPEQPDDAIRKLMSSCECLVGVATERLTAADREVPDRTLTLATPYLLQESSMAFQAELPRLVFKTPDVTLQGVTARNLYLEIRPALSSRGKVVFTCSEEALRTSLQELKRQALERRRTQQVDQWKKGVGWLATAIVGGAAMFKGADLMLRPPCFGDFYYADPECKGCEYKSRCKAEKAGR